MNADDISECVCGFQWLGEGACPRCYMKANKREQLIEHAGRIEQAMDGKIQDLEAAMDQVREIIYNLEHDEKFDEKDIRDELNGIWSCVMITPYDPKY